MLTNAKVLPAIGDEKNPMTQRKTLEPMRSHYRTPDPAVRRGWRG
jgi:hypothetical protein